jgi:hypothetical protein
MRYIPPLSSSSSISDQISSAPPCGSARQQIKARQKARGNCHAEPLKEKNRQNARVHPVELVKDVDTVISSDNREKGGRN